MLPSEMQEYETLFEFKNKVKSWNPIKYVNYAKRILEAQGMYV